VHMQAESAGGDSRKLPMADVERVKGTAQQRRGRARVRPQPAVNILVEGREVAAMDGGQKIGVHGPTRGSTVGEQFAFGLADHLQRVRRSLRGSQVVEKPRPEEKPAESGEDPEVRLLVAGTDQEEHVC
jgi:hypothetical protein